MHYIIWLLVAILYSPILNILYRSRWDSVDYTHAYFILPISLWLVWRNRAQLKEILSKTRKTGSIVGLIILILGVLMFILGWKNDYLFISTLSLIPVLCGLVIFLYGYAIAKTLSFPILYILLMVPPPLGILDNLTLPMRYWISVITEHILRQFSYPITRDGLLLSMGGYDIYMGPACSGFRSLITMISLGLVYIYIIKASIKSKVILLSSLIPLALFGNLIRVISVCLVTFYFGNEIGHKYHDASGFVIFVIMILGLVGLENLLQAISSKPHASS